MGLMGSNLKNLTSEIASKGRGSDTILAHINPQEAMLLKMLGGSGTINPITGLPEFGFLKKVVKTVTKPFKAVAKPVVKALGGGTLGAIGGAGLGYLLAPFTGGLSIPASMGIGGGLGGAAGAAISGKDPLKYGLMGLGGGYLGGVGLGKLGVGGTAGAGGFSSAELSNLGLTAADFAPGGIAGGIVGGGALAGTTVDNLVLQGIPYEEAVRIVGAGAGAAGRGLSTLEKVMLGQQLVGNVAGIAGGSVDKGVTGGVTGAGNYDMGIGGGLLGYSPKIEPAYFAKQNISFKLPQKPGKTWQEIDEETRRRQRNYYSSHYA